MVAGNEERIPAGKRNRHKNNRSKEPVRWAQDRTNYFWKGELMYCGKNFANKEDLEKAIKKGEKVSIFLPRWVRRITHQRCPANGITSVLGPHLHLKTGIDDKTTECKQHEWATDVRVEDGVIKEVF
jgi:hypothetical protein